MKRITSRQNSVVARYRGVAAGEDPDLLLLDGPHLVGDALTAGCHFLHLMVTGDCVDDPEIASLVARADAVHADIALASASVMAAVSPVRTASPIVAIARRPALGLASVFAATAPFVVVACDVQDPGNLGAMARVAEAAGASGVLTAGRSADPFGWKALRGSMGSALRLPIVASGTAEDAMAETRRHGCRIVAAVPRGGASLFEASLKGPVAVLVGGEGSGLSSTVIAASDDRVSIPMQPPVESLNAAVALAIIAYEARRQRG